MQPLMRQFNRRENDEAFKQRILITQHITKSVFQNLMKPAFKVPRSNSARRILFYRDDVESKNQHELENVLAKFDGDDSLDSYMETQYIQANHVDPNSFIIVEWEQFDGRKERARPYPFEVSAHEAIFFEYKKNILQYLVIKQKYQDTENLDLGREITAYTKYGINESIRLISVDDEEIIKKILPVGEEIKIAGITYIKIPETEEVFIVQRFKNTLGFVPAIRAGFRRDVVTDGRTMVSAIDEAIPILMKLVKANSELDLTMALHAFPQKVQYVPACKNKNCLKGKLINGDTCRTCKGSGIQQSASAQEIVDVEMPKTKEDMINLGDLVKYHSPEVDLVKFQDEYVKSLMAMAKDARFNSDVFSRKEVAETATGKNIDLQNVYDSLWGDAVAYRKTWRFLVKTVASVTDLIEGLIWDYKFSRDFKMKTLNDLYFDLKLIADSKADEFVKDSIQNDIAQLMYAESELELKRFKTKKAFFPYSGKRLEEIMYIVTTVDRKDFHKVLWESYGWIFDDIELEEADKGKNFYDYKKSKQKSVIDKKVKKIIAAMPPELTLSLPSD